MMLISSHAVSVDEKGRVNIPARFREHLYSKFGEQLVLLDMDGCIFAYPLEEWRRRFSDKFSQLPTYRDDVRRYVRSMYGRATECVLDRQGRLLLPSRLRDSAQIEKDAVIIGLENKFEIWSSENWKKQLSETSDVFEEDGKDTFIELEF